jgi:hypothetical protein
MVTMTIHDNGAVGRVLGRKRMSVVRSTNMSSATTNFRSRSHSSLELTRATHLTSPSVRTPQAALHALCLIAISPLLREIQLVAAHDHCSTQKKPKSEKKQLPIQLAAERVISKRYSRGMEDQEGKTKRSESALHRFSWPGCRPEY